MDIGGTGLQAMAREDGTGYTVGEGMSLDADGMGEVTEGDGTFRVMRSDDGMLMGTRFDADMEGDPLTVDAKMTATDNPAPKLSTDNRDTDFNEKGTMLEALGAKFAMGDLLGSGSATVTGPNVVAQVRDEMADIRDRVQGLVDLRSEGGLDEAIFRSQIIVQWGKADAEVTKIFGGESEQRLERTTSASRVVDAFDRLVDALSSEEAFAAATLENGPDKLQGFDARNATQARDAFNRNAWTAAARLGSRGSTRFGAAMFNELGNNRAKAGFGGAERAQAFAWSTMQAVRRAADVQAAGSATYEGGTLAADQAGKLYSGSIDISVSFTRMSVNGYITALANADTQEPWTQGLGGEVVGIHLPDAELTRRGAWNITTTEQNNTGRLQYAAQAGGEPDYPLGIGDATYRGQLLGRGDASGSEAMGTWSVKVGSTTLAGGFGATRGTDRPPPGAGVTGDLAKIGGTGSGDGRAMIEAKPERLGPVNADAGPPVVAARAAISSPNVLDHTNAKFKYQPRPMDTPGVADIADLDEYVVGNYTPNRAEVLEAEDWEGTKGNWVADARAEIVKKLSQLRQVIALGTAASADASDRAFANEQRQRLFDDIQDELAKVFGESAAAGYVEDDPDTAANEAMMELYTGVLTRESEAFVGTGWAAGVHEDYPVNSSGVAEDAGVIAEIEDVLEALGDADAFADAFRAGGIFASARDLRLAPYPSPSAMFGRARGKLLIKSDYTDYTRLGAWSHQISKNAADDLSLQEYERSERQELGAFAYSPLEPTQAYTNSSRLYPAGGTVDVTATYAGKTAAAQGDLFYRGDVEAKVFWDASSVTASTVKVTISNLEDTESGDPLQIGYNPTGSTDPVLGVMDVESLTWQAEVKQDGVVRFSKDPAVDLAVGVDTIGGEAVYRPAYGPRRTLTEAERTTYGPGIALASNLPAAPGQLRHYTGMRNSNNVSEFRIATAASANDYWVIHPGDGTNADPLGEMAFAGLSVGGTLNTDTADQAYIDAKAQYDAGVAALIYPKWLVAGIRVNRIATSTGEPPIGPKGTRILVFADGSTAMMSEHSDNNVALIGTAANPATFYRLPRYSNNPLLSDTPEALWYDYAHPWSTKELPTADGDGSTGGVGSYNADIGDGAPTMTLAQLAAAWLAANDQYVNIPVTEKTEALAGTLEGRFVGQDQQGPLGLIGTWSLTGGAFGLGAERGDIRGAFGADIQP